LDVVTCSLRALEELRLHLVALHLVNGAWKMLCAPAGEVTGNTCAFLAVLGIPMTSWLNSLAFQIELSEDMNVMANGETRAGTPKVAALEKAVPYGCMVHVVGDGGTLSDVLFGVVQ
jgi:hypothetical protein